MTSNALVNIYSQPMRGGELPYFVGKQIGNGWLKSLAKLAFPILRKLGGVAANTAEDVLLKEREMLPSLANNTVNAFTTRKRRSSINKLPYERKRKR